MKEPYLKFFWLLFLLSFVYDSYSDNKQNADCLYNQANNNQTFMQDSALLWLDKSKELYLIEGDTSKAIRSLIHSGSLYSTNANYSKSYDRFWEALILCDKIQDRVYSAEIYDGLSILYSLFYRYDEAEAYGKKAIELKKANIRNGLSDENVLTNSYYKMTILFREKEEYDLAAQYLDSCVIVKNKVGGTENSYRYIKAEKAFLSYYRGEYSEAEELINNLIPQFDDRSKSFRVILYSFLGDIYRATKKSTKSELNYELSIKTARDLNAHRNFLPRVYKKLSDLCVDGDNFEMAYYYMVQSAQLNDSIFGARSENNSSLLEIKDAYRFEIEKQKQLAEQIKITNLEREHEKTVLRNTVLIAIMAILLAVSLLIHFYIRNRYRFAHNMLITKQKVKDEKNREILEMKNKELTTSALQLIEKDEQLKRIKQKLFDLKSKDDDRAISGILNEIKASNMNDWNEFNARFTSVNERFYEKLKEQFPELTQRDHKLCALVKLNFSSKEMSRLLGISVESVHTSRYRLRQKLNLGKGDNLTEFIANI